VTTLVGRRFDVVELFDTIEREQINALMIVGEVDDPRKPGPRRRGSIELALDRGCTR
jgi:hypothetical protein